MKKTVLVFSLILYAVCIYAQVQQPKIEAEIKKLEEKERMAMFGQDTVTLKRMWAEDFTVNAPFNRITTTTQELLDMVNKGAIRFSSFTRTVERIILKENIAITMGSEQVVFTGNASQAGQLIKRRYTNIWLKQNGEWKLSLRHANNICTE